MGINLLYNVENENKEKGKLYQQDVDLGNGERKSYLFVRYNDTEEYVEQISSGSFVTQKGIKHNIWHII